MIRENRPNLPKFEPSKIKLTSHEGVASSPAVANFFAMAGETYRRELPVEREFAPFCMDFFLAD
jgi:hypothetical protein